MMIQDWERAWAPYDEQTYQTVLGWIDADDVVLDIGAGDLRLARRMAAKAAHVFAIEIDAALLPPADTLPDNLVALHRDATTTPFPPGVTTAVLLMRHCTRFRHYAEKLRAVGCRRLITNARWRTGVERIDLAAERRPYRAITLGWDACWCGAVGFVPGRPEQLVPESEQIVHEIHSCPACVGTFMN